MNNKCKLSIFSDGKKRGLGVLIFEDKIVQKAVAMILETVHEPVF